MAAVHKYDEGASSIALLNNPLGELLGPVGRLERAVAKLSGEISAVQALPRIEEELAETRAAMVEMLEVLRALADDVVRLRAAGEQLAGGTGQRGSKR